MEGYEYCLEDNCDQPVTTDQYCRYHYIMHWHKIRMRKKILSENQLQKQIQQLVESHSPKLLDYMVRDLSNESDFSVALEEMKSSSSEG